MPNEMIERVAKAIGEKWHKGKEWNEIAKAAIEAMKEPTEAMCKSVGVGTQGEIAKVYTLMIEAALKDV